MQNKKKVLMLIGSPKPERSTSGSIANYLESQMEQAPIQVEKMQIRKQLMTSEGCGKLIEAFQQAHVILLISPLYVDSLPAPVIRVLELIASNRTKTSREQIFMAIINAGFPEAAHNETALAICQNFVRECGMKWGGGLAVGMGGSISGAPLDKLGGMVRKLRKALELTAESVVAGEDLPIEAIRLAAIPSMPCWFYRLMGNIGWKMQARKYGVSNMINSRPDTMLTAGVVSYDMVYKDPEKSEYEE